MLTIDDILRVDKFEQTYKDSPKYPQFTEIHRCEPMITKDSPVAAVVLRVMVKGLCVREEQE